MRHSVDSAEWSFEREGRYRAESEDIAFRAGAQLLERGSDVLIVIADTEELLVSPSKPSRTWYESWLALRDRFPHLR